MRTVEKPGRGNVREAVRTGEAGEMKEKAVGEVEKMEEDVGIRRH